MPGAYYNEIDRHAAAKLRRLIHDGLIPDGEVDERDIRDVKGSEIEGYTQCHFFAGIGGWPLSLRLARWPDARPVWTGSCPCQPFSIAGAQKGLDDDRHLWPAWYALIRERAPAVVFGEQVEAAIRYGWLDAVSDDLERENYAVGPVVLPACSVGSPHLRQRVWFVAERVGDGKREGLEGLAGDGDSQAGREVEGGSIAASGAVGELGHADLETGQRGAGTVSSPQTQVDSEGGEHGQFGDGSADAGQDDRPGPVNGFWRDADWLHCTDGKWRPVEPGTFPLAHGIPGRLESIRQYGNAIVPQVAAEVIMAYMESVSR